ncbi:hypothetical protein LWI29_018745 [Acer saccharum]|uniref:Cationic amino acid transporter C-terminal domain-containing protein n=1 Tax=Acer saccharum TaxID=4024 RepID=A0AA39S299_ACESA|nr:hypothetical protein LWI29_018745 [Acer saccharum]
MQTPQLVLLLSVALSFVKLGMTDGGFCSAPSILDRPCTGKLQSQHCLHLIYKVDSYAYLPPNYEHSLMSDGSATLVVFERRYASLENHNTEHFVGSTDKQPLLETPGEVFQLRKLLPQSMPYDFNIHIMDFQPGEFLNVKEVHYNQHGLLLLEGQGIYRLGDSWYPVQAGDVIWMAPFVPQWYAALGKTRSRYLIYKDVNRNPLLRKRMLATWTPNEELNQVRLRSGADMKRKLMWYDLVALGVGGMLGVGVFVTTGPVALQISGPSVFISYIIAGISALLSSLCYTEFSVQIPVAGGAFSYLRVTLVCTMNKFIKCHIYYYSFVSLFNWINVIVLGEFVGYFAGANILMEYVLSNAAVARSFTDYFCQAVGEQDINSWRVQVDGLVEGYNMLDFPAVALVLLLTLCLCHSTKESSILNLIMTVFHVIFFAFIIIAGFWNGSGDNLVKPGGLAPFGVKGVLDGAAIVYFSYIGYDSVSTMAEEIQNPSKSLPIGIVGSVLVVSLLYCLMALSLCIMVPYNKITKAASFSMAFEKMGWKWASNVVGAGASMGIVASLLVAMLGQARYLCVFGRARLVPSWLAKVHPSTGTPLNATLFLGLCTASIALFTDLNIVLEMISISTLLVFYLVANALIYRRYVTISNNPPFHTLVYLSLLSCSAIAFAISLKFEQQRWGMPLFGGLIIIITALFHYMVPCYNHNTREWSVPFMPWPAVVSIFLNVFLMTTLKMLSYQRFAIWACLITLFYVLYGVHSTYEAEEEKKLMIVQEVPPNPSISLQQSKLQIQVL